MKKLWLLILMGLATASVAMAQSNTPLPPPGTPPALSQNPPTFNTALGADVLGAHNGYGRGCVMCHAPHSGALGNGLATSSDSNNGMYALWGENLTPYYGQTYNFAGDGNSPTAKYPVTLPTASNLNALFAARDGTVQILFCLSCHDGSTARVGMMRGVTVEALPVVGGTAPTLLGTAAPSNGAAYNNDHPVGPSANVSCGGYGWDCTGGGNTTTKITPGPNMLLFMTNYPASFWNNTNYPLASYTTGTVNGVTCTTCHDQHSMIVYTNSKGSYSTMFFIKGQYAPTTGGNSVAQFCRNCHGGESNEMHGLTSVPTT